METNNFFLFNDLCIQIKVSFLMVGHTHEDIDQMFSRFSTSLMRHKVHTLSCLIELLPKAFQKPNVTAERISNILNYREWFLPHLNPVAEHSKPHVFKFTLDETGKSNLWLVVNLCTSWEPTIFMEQIQNRGLGHDSDPATRTDLSLVNVQPLGLSQ